MSEAAPTEGRAAVLRAAFDDAFAAAPIAADTAAERLLIVSVAGERLLIRLADIAGLFADRRLVAVPRTKPALLGIIGLRGAIVPVFALSVVLGYPPPQRRPRWLVTAAARPLAFAFDGFEGHVEISRAAIVPRGAGGVMREAATVGVETWPLVDLRLLAETV
jgi:purine-binding chemotaxis protein CheW